MAARRAGTRVAVWNSCSLVSEGAQYIHHTRSLTGWLPGNARSKRETLELGTSLSEVGAPIQRQSGQRPMDTSTSLLEKSFDSVFN